MSRSHRLRWFPAAYDDLRDARDWYEEQSTGLGSDFVAQFWLTVDALDKSPAVPRVVDVGGEQVRRWHFAGSWPYSIVYMIEDQTVVIVAVHHDRRHPGYWSHRRG